MVLSFVCPDINISFSSVEQVQSRDGGFFWFLHLWFGQLDPTHCHHSTDSKVSPNAAHAQPEGPVKAVIQYYKVKEVLLKVCHPLSQVVVLHGCEETQNTQSAEQSWKQKRQENLRKNIKRDMKENL